MKRIHLVRHAKSSWKDTSLADVDRPLNQRGIETCQLMAQHIYHAGCQFDKVFCSPALRARMTIEMIRDAAPSINMHWQVIDQLYTFDSTYLHHWCSTLDESITEPVIVGHNPTLIDFCNELCGLNIENIPTCGYAQLTATDDFTWQNLSAASFELTVFLRPKELIR